MHNVQTSTVNADQFHKIFIIWGSCANPLTNLDLIWRETVDIYMPNFIFNLFIVSASGSKKTAIFEYLGAIVPIFHY